MRWRSAAQAALYGMATIAEILYVWAKFVNWRDRRKQRKEMEGYEAVPQDLIFFRPVEQHDLSRIKKLEVTVQPPYIHAHAGVFEH